MSPELIIALTVFFILLFVGIPVAFVLGISSITYFLYSGKILMLRMLAQRLFEGMDNFVLMAIPLFLMAGELMNEGKLTGKLVNFAEILVGRLRGGLAYVNILASMLFAGITGSALSDVAALGSMLIPTMNDSGYDNEFSTAVTAASAIQGPIIPPSIPAVLIAATSGTSVGALFMGGILPGIMLGLGASVIVFFVSKKRNYPKREVNYTKKEVMSITKDSLLALLTPVIILGGILFGVFTPTEAAAMAVLYAFILTYVVYRAINIKDIIGIFKRVIIGTSKIYLIIGTATVFAWILSIEGVPRMATRFLSGFGTSAYSTLLLINLLLLFWGMWMDTAPSIMVLAPILFPIAQNIGIHPIHFGVIMVVNLMIGLLTPPFGMALFSAVAVSGVSLKGLLKELWPYLIVDVVILLLVTYVPQISLWIPELVGLI